MSDVDTQKRKIPSGLPLRKWICSYPPRLRWGGLIIITQLWISCAPTIQAPLNTRFLELRVGQFDPQNSEAGYMVGISRGRRIDDRVWWQLEGNYFKTSYTRVTTVADVVSGNQLISTRKAEINFSTTIYSIFLGFYYESSLGNRFFYRGSGNLGWEYIVVSEKNDLAKASRTRTFIPPGLLVSTGVGMGISKSSMVFGDLFYNGAKAPNNNNSYGAGLPIHRDINVSGFGFRIGINFLNFKFL